ncbi:MAG: glycosyltransferase family 2 protein [Lentisphaerae bacterium]|nr:glycosyltransferase family 2 protein [Lentisphaerota bacterium]
MVTVPISVIIPTWRRPAILLTTLNAVAHCEPQPAEVVVHIDANDDETEAALAAAPLPVRLLHTKTTLGPGGGRNRLMQAASHDILVSLDDDSRPIDKDFFRQIMQWTDRHPEYAAFTIPSWIRDETPTDVSHSITESSGFEGCSVVLRRDAVMAVSGYIPLRYAYGMEETDMALQLLDAGFALARVNSPHVRHDISPGHHAHPAVDRAWLVNTALLPFLRYPFPYILLLPLKVLRRMAFSLKYGRFGTVCSGLASIPGTLWHYRELRAPVKCSTMHRYIKLTRSVNR